MALRTILPVLIPLLALLGTCLGQDDTQSYPCPEGQAMLPIQHKTENILDCEQTWETHNKTIAIYHGSAQCTKPCVNVSQEGIVLRECVDVLLTITCERPMVTEQRIRFLGQKGRAGPVSAVPIQDRTPSSPQPSQHLGLVAALCLFAVIGGVAFVHHQHFHRNSDQPSNHRAVQDLP